MTKQFQKFFSEWVKKNNFYLVTGSDLPKLQEQMDGYDIEAEAIFTCCGNQMWIPDPSIVNVSAYPIYENKFDLPKHLEEFLNIMLANSKYSHRYGNHIENRGSMVNFSIVGRDCTLEQRKDYFEWDKKHKERQKIANIIKSNNKDIDAVIGGEISIDIYPKGKDKSQIFRRIKTQLKSKHPMMDFEYVFFGDRIEEGGNDYPLAKLMEKTPNCKFHQVKDYRKTWWHLQRYELGLEK